MSRRPRADVAADHWFKVRVTAEELEAIRAKARAAGVNASQLVRSWIAGESAPAPALTAPTALYGVATVAKAAERAPMTDADARPRPDVEPDFRSRWTPRHVWTLHMVPGRLDGPPLAVRRRVLSDWGEAIRVEMPGGALSADEEALAVRGVERRAGGARCDGADGLAEETSAGFMHYEISVDVFDHCPTAEERAEWKRVHQIEQVLLKSPPTHVWAALPGKSTGRRPVSGDVPDRAVKCTAIMGRRSEVLPLQRHDLEVILPGYIQRGPLEYYMNRRTIDVRELAEHGYVAFESGDVRRISLLKPSAKDLRALGEERAAAAREAERERVEGERFAEAWARAWGHAPASKPEVAPGLAALRELGLEEGATAEDVRAVFRERVKAGHPDQGGREDMGRLVELRNLALGYVETTGRARAGGRP